MTAVSATAGPSLADILELVGIVLICAPLGIPLARAFVWLQTPAAERPRRRYRRSAAVSPAAAERPPAPKVGE